MSDTQERYNGWSNYPTWAVNLWLTNDEGSDSYWRATAQEIVDEIKEELDEVPEWLTKEQYAAQELAERLKDEITEQVRIEDAILASDLLSFALELVNWDEIASNWIEDCDWSPYNNPDGVIRASDMDVGDEAYDIEEHITVYLDEFEGQRYMRRKAGGNPYGLPKLDKDDDEVNY